MKRKGWRETTVGEYLAEALGTFVLIAFGTGVVAMTVAALNQSGRGEGAGLQTAGDWMPISLGWGLAVMLGVYVAGGVTGAHLNPAVTLAQAVRRGFPWAKVPGYMAAQLVGAFLGAALVFLVYHDAISAFEAANDIDRNAASGAATFGIFGTGPAPYFTSFWGPLIDQVVGTGLLVMAIFAVTDELNAPVKSNLGPLIVGLIVVAIGLSFGANAGYAINPARDLGPRLLAFFAGWGENALPGKTDPVSAYLWVPIVGPLIGGVIGAVLYDGVIRTVLKARGAQPDAGVESGGRDVIDKEDQA